MPVDVSIKVPKPGQPKEFKRYTPREIRDAWEADGHFTIDCLNKDSRFIVFFTNYVLEALVISALFVRELDSYPECTHYDYANKALLLFYPVQNQKTLSDEMARALALDLIERVMIHRDIKKIRYDVWGEKLFLPMLGE